MALGGLMRFLLSGRSVSVLVLSLVMAAAGGGSAMLGDCGPFTDVAADAFCPLVLEIFYMGITTGTTATTYDPDGNVTRVQMAAFLSRTVDRTLQRGSRRAALKLFWTPRNADVLGMTTLGVGGSQFVESDGTDIWVSAVGSSAVERVRGGDGKPLETWTGAVGAESLVYAMGSIFVAGFASPSWLYRIIPSQPAGSVMTLASNLGDQALGIAFDGARIWTGNGNGTVSIVTQGPTIPWSVFTTAPGIGNTRGMLWDGANMWATDFAANKLLKLSDTGSILQTVTVGNHPQFPVFDGTNIWVPNADSDSVSVVRASNGVVLATLTGNGLSFPFEGAFDGQRILITDDTGDGVSLWKAADLTTIGFIPTGTGSFPGGACSDGTSFWVVLTDAPGQLA